MRLLFNRDVFEIDLKEILEYYNSRSGSKLADDFREEFDRKVEAAFQMPTSFPKITTKHRSVRLNRFPFLCIANCPDGIRIIVLRHIRRNPNYGMDRE